MTTVNADVRLSTPTTAPPSDVPARPSGMRWSREIYYRLNELGFFENQRVELIEGEILKMPAQSNLHAIVVDHIADALRRMFGKGYWIRAQFTIDLTEDSSPDPDLAVVAGDRADWAKSKDNPSSALLIVEVSVTTGPYDKGPKASVYAKAGIEDYWVVDVPRRQLQVRRKPAADETQPFGFGYSELRTLDLTDEVSTLALPEAKVKVSDLLPA